MRSLAFSPYRQSARPTRSGGTATGAAELLRAHDKMAALLPTVARIVALKKDCVAALPVMFESCEVLHFDAGQLTLAVPNAALAAKLKQQLPNLQGQLLKRGWQVSAIRLKVQVVISFHKETFTKRLALPSQAVSAFAQLCADLDESPQNQTLKQALLAMVARHREKAE